MWANTFRLFLFLLGADTTELLGFSGESGDLGIVEPALVIDAVDAEVDGGPQDAVEVTGLVAHWTVPGRVWPSEK